MKLSIITPTRNRLAYLKENVASVRASVTHPLDLEIEHVILDCGSDDGTAEYLHELRESPGIVVILESGPIPPGEARNLAIGRASGELLMPLDDDDILLQRTAFNFSEALSGRQAQWAVSGYLKIDDEGRYLPGEDYYPWAFGSPDEMLGAIFSGRHFIQGNVCFRRELFDAAGGYASIPTAEDLELYTRFVLHSGLPVCIPAISHLHRVHDSNVSRDIDKTKYNEDMARIYEAHRKALQERGVSLVLIP